MTIQTAERIFRYCGRHFSSEEIEQIRRLIAGNPEQHRLQLSRLVCGELNWRRADGRPKEMSCRVAMLRMERDGLITLPPPLTTNGNGRSRPLPTSRTDPQEPILLPSHELGKLLLRLVDTPRHSTLWNELIQRYHYLGYKPLPGAQLRYLIYAERQLVAALGFGAAAWKVAPRDNWIGWTHQQRTQNLHLIVNNARFLILPWVRSKNLGSTILATAAKQLANDWQQQYSYRPVLLETFVQLDKFQGTCYRAANWIKLGYTKGRGKLDVKNEYKLPIKAIFVYPIQSNARALLTSENAVFSASKSGDFLRIM